MEFIIWFLAFYVWHAVGITVGYHRLLSHRSFACPKLIEYFFVLGGYLVWQGSPIWWSAIHRAHHRFVDTELDPHSPRYGMLNAHIGWITHKTYPAHIDPAIHTKDLLDDPIYAFLEQGGRWHRAHWLNFFLGMGFRVVILACFGWQAALASLIAGAIVWQVPFMLNVICHLPKLGYKNYAVEDDSVNVWWVAVLAMGEGWHNNHHACPGSAKTGMRPWELDISWLTISALRRLGLAWRVNQGIDGKVMTALAPAPIMVPLAAPIFKVKARHRTSVSARLHPMSRLAVMSPLVMVPARVPVLKRKG